MELKSGYKQTEVGVIPEDWDVRNLEQLADLYQPVTIAASKFSEHGYPVYGANGLVGYFNQYNHETWQTAITCRGSTCGTVNRIPAKSWITGNAMVANCDKTVNLSKDYLYFALKGSDLSDCITGTGQPQIVRGPLARFSIPLPPTKAEQEAIAEALSDADALIASLEQLIAKKRLIKQGAMQKLLTGKRRLPGFSGDWEEKMLGELLTVHHGKSQREVEVLNGKYPILASGGEIGRTDTPLYEYPSVLIGRKGTIDAPQYASTPFWTVDTLFYTKVAADADPKFIFYKFNLIPWRRYNEASGVPSLNAKTIELIEVFVPSGKKEQIAIATALSEMDTEIDALETKLSKARLLKHGMMQELLTGKIRLV